MAELPRGTVTFLFTDVEQSTRLLAELGAVAYGQALEEHRQRLREAFGARRAWNASSAEESVRSIRWCCSVARLVTLPATNPPSSTTSAMGTSSTRRRVSAPLPAEAYRAAAP